VARNGLKKMWPSENKVANRLKKLGWQIEEIDRWVHKKPYADFIICKNGLKRVIEVKTVTKGSNDKVICYHKNFNFMIVTSKYFYYVIPISKITNDKAYLHLRDYSEYKNRFDLLNLKARRKI